MPEWRSIELGIYAVYPSRKFLAPKLRVLIDLMVESFKVPVWGA
jgi:DNA-binding transcriptional LysR family regulator